MNPITKKEQIIWNKEQVEIIFIYKFIKWFSV